MVAVWSLVIGLVIGVCVAPWLYYAFDKIEARLMQPAKDKPLMLGYLPAYFNPQFKAKTAMESLINYLTKVAPPNTFTVTNCDTRDPPYFVDIFSRSVTR